jgi:hypothetical protein
MAEAFIYCTCDAGNELRYTESQSVLPLVTESAMMLPFLTESVTASSHVTQSARILPLVTQTALIETDFIYMWDDSNVSSFTEILSHEFLCSDTLEVGDKKRTEIKDTSSGSNSTCDSQDHSYGNNSKKKTRTKQHREGRKKTRRALPVIRDARMLDHDYEQSIVMATSFVHGNVALDSVSEIANKLVQAIESTDNSNCSERLTKENLWDLKTLAEYPNGLLTNK